MRRLAIALTAAALAAGATAGPAAAAGDPLGDAISIVKCAGEALGGNACHQG